jgi:hypothetical protein
VFVAYRRPRSAETVRLAAALRVHGVPTWQDLDDLGPHNTEAQIRAILADSSTAGAVIWIGPEMAGSAFVPGIEIPEIVKRQRRGDGFFVQAVACGGLGPAKAGAIASERLGLTSLQHWNLHAVSADPATDAEIATLARRVLDLRLAAIDERLGRAEPLTIHLSTRPDQTESALVLDWSAQFGSQRVPQRGSWARELRPALDAVQRAIVRHRRDRPLRASGYAPLSAGAALGYAFRQTTGIAITFTQQTDGRQEDWSLALPEECRLEVEAEPYDSTGTAVGLLISITQSVEAGFAQLRSSRRLGLRGVVRVTWPEGLAGGRMSPGQAAATALRVQQELRSARASWGLVEGRLHVCMAGPLGLAVLLGQVLNTWGPVTFYEQGTRNAYVPGLTFGP